MAKATRHTITGKVDLNTPEHYIDHPFFGQYLEVVEPDAKDYADGLFTPGTVESRAALRPATPDPSDRLGSPKDEKKVASDKDKN